MSEISSSCGLPPFSAAAVVRCGLGVRRRISNGCSMLFIVSYNNGLLCKRIARDKPEIVKEKAVSFPSAAERGGMSSLFREIVPNAIER